MTQPDTSADDAVKRGIADALQHVLGNTCRLSTTCTSFRWNVTGSDAPGVRIVLNAQCDEMNQGREKLAKRLRSLGFPAIASFTDEVVVPLTDADRTVPPARQMLVLLRQGHSAMRMALKAANDIAVDGDDTASSLLLAQRMLAHDEHAAELGAMIDD